LEGGKEMGEKVQGADNATNKGFLTGLVISAFSKTLVLVLGISVVLIQVSYQGLVRSNHPS
jgi:hypothetical protein